MRIIILLSFLFTSACAQLAVTREDSSTKSETKELHFASFGWGFLQLGRTLDENELCTGGKIDKLDFGMGTGDVLLSAVTIGIYTPYRIKVTCRNRQN